jgi:dinuclear metal center YbgI/SA1388 family protein
MKLAKLADYLDKYLRNAEFEDKSLNGLQVEGRAEVKSIALAVDFSRQSIQKAQEIGADLLIVHHGLLWAPGYPLVGYRYHRLKTLLESGIALYASHLPLDAHPVVGNNAQLAKKLGLTSLYPFGEYHGRKIGYAGRFSKPRRLKEIEQTLAKQLGSKISCLSLGKETISTVGISCGGGGFAYPEAITLGLDLLIVGEPYHEAFHPALESGLSLIFAGHYGTETLGVKALGRHLARKFRLSTQFSDIPTGL